MTGGHLYRVYGLILEANRPLHSLEPLTGSERASITISFVAPDAFKQVVPHEDLSLPEGDWIAHAFLPDGRFYLHAVGVVEAIISADGRDVFCAARETADARAVEANLLNIVLGTALTLAGEEPLHGTALDLGGHAIGLLGHSGAGKSTLAALLVRQGARLLTDDVLRIEFVGSVAMVHPGPYRLKLFEEPARRYLPDSLADGHFNALSGKVMIPPPESSLPRPEAGVRLDMLYYLGDLPGHPEPCRVESVPLSSDETIRTLLSSAMDDRNKSPERLARQLQFIGRLAERTGIRALRYPRRFDLMEAVTVEIARTAQR